MRTKALVLSGLIVLFATLSAERVSAQAFLGFVTPPDLAGPTWTGQVTGGGGLQFVADPSGGIVGDGSLQFMAADPDAGAQLRFSDMGWTLALSQLVALQYRALAAGEQCKHDKPKKPNHPDQNRGLILVLDVDTDGDFVADDALVFDPAVNGDVLCGTWQTWDAKNGLWYSAEDKKGIKNAAPLSDYVSMYPNARLVYGGIRVIAAPGGKGKGFVGNLDSLSLEGPPSCSNGGCVSGPAPTYLFRVGPSPI
jgi:hypothetical protein